MKSSESSVMLRDIYEKVQRIETLLISGTRLQPISPSQYEEDPEPAAALDALGER